MVVPEVRAGSYPTREGNRVTAWIDGEPAFARIRDAIVGARGSVWSTIAFLWPDFRLPGEQDDLLAVLDRAAARGVDVRLLCWRPGPGQDAFLPTTFWGSPGQLELLRARDSQVAIRWDTAAPGFCQHQKSWIVDAGLATETAFLGGINCNPRSVVRPGHANGPGTHDAYVEIVGPAAIDVHHNFVQRWNAATGGDWPAGASDDLPLPDRVPAVAGNSRVRIQRTLSPTQAAAETSILDQYLAAIGAAERTIYIENQYVEEPSILSALAAALDRGVYVIAVVPAGDPDAGGGRARLAGHARLLLAGLASSDEVGRLHHVYVHDKLMIVDDAWATVGSANLHHWSLHGNAELNASVWDPAFATALRVELFAEHLGRDTSGLDDLAAFRCFAEIARRNATAPPTTSARGLAFALEPAPDRRRS
jgi:phosphatidylserine/phosphatidylglycerophosphate/cardiolipin synthase-like enzyme